MTTETIEHPDRIVVYPSRRKAALVLLGAIGFVVLGIWIGSPGMAPRVSLFSKVVCTYIGVPFFALCGLYAAYRLAIRRPAVVIDRTGITDTSNAFAPGHLDWNDIDCVLVYEYHKQPMLGILPKNLDLFLDRQNASRRAYYKMNLALKLPPVNIAQVILPMKVTELARLLHARYGVRVEGERLSELHLSTGT